jgi:hypothetical protein
MAHLLIITARVLVLWTALSIPLALFVGRVILGPQTGEDLPEQRGEGFSISHTKV